MAAERRRHSITEYRCTIGSSVELFRCVHTIYNTGFNDDDATLHVPLEMLCTTNYDHNFSGHPGRLLVEVDHTI